MSIDPSTPPQQASDFQARIIVTDWLPDQGPPSPLLLPLPPFPPPIPPPFPPFDNYCIPESAKYKAEINSLKLASADGRLQDVHQILVQYMLTQIPDSSTGELRLRMFYESIIEAVLHQHPSVVSYLFFMRVGKPAGLCIWAGLESRSTAIFQVFLDHGWNINEPLERTRPPPLGYVTDDRALTEWFLDQGADPNAGCFWDLTPMSEAMFRAPLDTIKFLFDRGGDIEKGQLLHHAAQRVTPDAPELIDLLLDRGASINEIEYKNHWDSWNHRCAFGLGTPLHYAAEVGNVQVVRFLLSRGADATIKDTRGKTALEQAELYRRLEVIDLLQSKPKLSS